MQTILDDGTKLIQREKDDLAYELKRNRLMLAGKVLSNSINIGLKRAKKEIFDEFTVKMQNEHH